MRSWIIGVCALLSAGAAQAEAGREPYAKVGAWEITADAAKNLCTMSRLYGMVDAEDTEGLLVIYNAQREGVLLGVASNKLKFLPSSGSLDFDLTFVTGSSLNESWGSRPFEYKKPDGRYLFTHVFTGPADVQRILRDLAGNEILSLFFGPTVMTGLPLDASGAVEKLRECSLKLAGRDFRDPLPK